MTVGSEGWYLPKTSSFSTIWIATQEDALKANVTFFWNRQTELRILTNKLSFTKMATPPPRLTSISLKHIIVIKSNVIIILSHAWSVSHGSENAKISFICTAYSFFKSRSTPPSTTHCSYPWLIYYFIIFLITCALNWNSRRRQRSRSSSRPRYFRNPCRTKRVRVR